MPNTRTWSICRTSPTTTTRFLSRRLIRWQPETIVQLPAGIGILPFMLPGSPALMEARVESLPDHRVTVWSKRGVMARSDISVTRAVDRIEYAETGARHEYIDLMAGGRGEGLTAEESTELVREFGVETSLFKAIGDHRRRSPWQQRIEAAPANTPGRSGAR